MSVFLSFSFEILETHVLFSGVFAFFWEGKDTQRILI